MKNETLLLQSLHNSFSKGYYKEQLFLITKGEKSVSLRSVDWFITNYSKKHNIYYKIYKDKENNYTFTNNNNTTLIKNVNVFQSYKAQLKAYSKKKFDPFCRRDRLDFEINDTIINTTIGQLNFFKWAIDNLIIDYIVEHREKIENDMNNSLKEMKENGILYKKKGERKLRQELSLSATRGLSRTDISTTLNFD
tara:strand:- start:193 stop:774 length:582 start_codon:yes stop_codon:yes gene_type:complete